MPTTRAELAVAPGCLDEATAWARGVLEEWRLTSPLLTAWLPWARQFAGAEPFDLVFEYDADMLLLTCDVTQDGHHRFGLDDFVMPPSTGPED